jgi:hypothetical protein
MPNRHIAERSWSGVEASWHLHQVAVSAHWPGLPHTKSKDRIDNADWIYHTQCIVLIARILFLWHCKGCNVTQV